MGDNVKKSEEDVMKKQDLGKPLPQQQFPITLTPNAINNNITVNPPPPITPLISNNISPPLNNNYYLTTTPPPPPHLFDQILNVQLIQLIQQIQQITNQRDIALADLANLKNKVLSDFEKKR